MTEAKPLVAALFVQADGCYVNDARIDAWPESRDARLYAGDLPVIAHPPCQRWGALGRASFARWGGEHNRPGNDGGCFASALESVRRCGGVLEHPAGSTAWDAFGLLKPHGTGWLRAGLREWVCEVWQSAYGHRARKATWLFYVGPPPFEMLWDRIHGTHQIGYWDKRGKARNKPTLSKAEANATPPDFREALIGLALGARLPRVVSW